MFTLTASVGFSSYNQFIAEPHVNSSYTTVKIVRDFTLRNIYSTYQDKRRIGTVNLKKRTWRGIHFENKSSSTITIQEVYIQHKIGQKTQRNITIKPMGTQYVDFKGGLRVVKQVRIVWKATKPDSRVKVYFRH